MEQSTDGEAGQKTIAFAGDVIIIISARTLHRMSWNPAKIDNIIWKSVPL
jgi:hypothetical protein